MSNRFPKDAPYHRVWQVTQRDGNAAHAIDAPLRYLKPSNVRVTVDLFHESVPDDFIAQVFAVMALAPHHTFQVLTKRPERMRALLSDDDFAFQVEGYASDFAQRPVSFDLPLPNVWLGTSAEDQATFDQRVAELLQTPAAVRWVSLEPLLAPVDVSAHLGGCDCGVGGLTSMVGGSHHSTCTEYSERLDWVVVGGESGPKARPFDIQWARDIIAQCQAAGVPCFVNQLGALPCQGNQPGKHGQFRSKAALGIKHRAGGDMAEWPVDLQVREWPEVAS